MLIYAHCKLRAVGVSDRSRRTVLRRLQFFVGVFVLAFSVSLVDLAIRWISGALCSSSRLFTAEPSLFRRSACRA